MGREPEEHLATRTAGRQRDARGANRRRSQVLPAIGGRTNERTRLYTSKFRQERAAASITIRVSFPPDPFRFGAARLGNRVSVSSLSNICRSASEPYARCHATSSCEPRPPVVFPSILRDSNEQSCSAERRKRKQRGTADDVPAAGTGHTARGSAMGRESTAAWNFPWATERTPWGEKQDEARWRGTACSRRADATHRTLLSLTCESSAYRCGQCWTKM